jgi:hypothetical protein
MLTLAGQTARLFMFEEEFMACCGDWNVLRDLTETIDWGGKEQRKKLIAVVEFCSMV